MEIWNGTQTFCSILQKCQDAHGSLSRKASDWSLPRWIRWAYCGCPHEKQWALDAGSIMGEPWKYTDGKNPDMNLYCIIYTVWKWNLIYNGKQLGGVLRPEVGGRKGHWSQSFWSLFLIVVTVMQVCCQGCILLQWAELFLPVIIKPNCTSVSAAKHLECT